MPLYEYCCRACGLKFEALVRGPNTVACPSCAAVDLERLVSSFAPDSESTRDAAQQSSLPRSRKVQRDREVAERETYERHRH
jgi:putative FmdB family regulatory protein